MYNRPTLASCETNIAFGTNALDVKNNNEFLTAVTATTAIAYYAFSHKKYRN